MRQYYIQYHNADNMGYFPGSKSKKVERISIFTKKQTVQKAIGEYCFLIVGAGKKNKQYYLWSFFEIGKVKKENDEFIASGRGFNFAKPILLNDLPNYADFKNFCGNFGIGFQNITKHKFSRILIAFSDNVNLKV